MIEKAVVRALLRVVSENFVSVDCTFWAKNTIILSRCFDISIPVHAMKIINTY